MDWNVHFRPINSSKWRVRRDLTKNYAGGIRKPFLGYIFITVCYDDDDDLSIFNRSQLNHSHVPYCRLVLLVIIANNNYKNWPRLVVNSVAGLVERYRWWLMTIIMIIITVTQWLILMRMHHFLSSCNPVTTTGRPVTTTAHRWTHTVECLSLRTRDSQFHLTQLYTDWLLCGGLYNITVKIAEEWSSVNLFLVH